MQKVNFAYVSRYIFLYTKHNVIYNKSKNRLRLQSIEKKTVHYRMAPALPAWIIVSHSRESLIGFPIEVNKPP